MKSSLLKGESIPRKKEIKESYSAGLTFIRKLREVLNDKISLSNKEIRNTNFLENNDFAIRLSNEIGFQRGLEYVLELLEDDK